MAQFNKQDTITTAMKLAMECGRTGSCGQKELITAIKVYLNEIYRIYSRFSGTDLQAYNDEGIVWLCDNWPLAEREGREVIEGLKQMERLPESRRMRKIPCIFILCRGIACQPSEEIDEELINAFFDGWQNVRILEENELSAFITMLKAAIVEEVWRESRRLKENNEEITQETAARLKRAFDALRFFSTADYGEVIRKSNKTDMLLMQDPAGIYGNMDERSCVCYRRNIRIIAKEKNATEYETTKRLIETAGHENLHVGTVIERELRECTNTNRKGTIYFSFLITAAVIFTIAGCMIAGRAWLAPLLLFPAWELARLLTDYFTLRTTPPCHIPRLALEDGIPEEGKTLCVITTLLIKPGDGNKYFGLLEEYMLANRDSGSNVLFGLLADLKDSNIKETPEDTALIDGARQAADALCKKYGGGFYLFTRERIYNEREKKYMVRERKRGALLDLMATLRHKPAVQVYGADPEKLDGIRFLITLDSDTRLEPFSVVPLIGAMMHPCNTPVIVNGRVVSGYGVMLPRIVTSLKAANATVFSRLNGGHGGTDPYGSSMSDLYQDVFGEAVFTGKGIIHIDAYLQCMEEVIPDNQVLSHDLLESGYLRAALVNNVEITDGCPSGTGSYFARLGRWIRGDIQIVPWLCKRVRDGSGAMRDNPINALTKYKIIDNIRRIIAPVVLTAVLLMSAFMNKGERVALSLGAAAGIMTPWLAGITSSVLRKSGEYAYRYHSTVIAGFGGALMGIFTQLALLPRLAWVSIASSAKSVWRMSVSHRYMLEWVTAGEAELAGKKTWGAYIIRGIPALLAGAVMLFSKNIYGIAIACVWLLAPVYEKFIGSSMQNNWKPNKKEKQYLLDRCAEIWRYFDELLRPEDNFLPPDNWQEQPAAGTAHRTSPTDIGFSLACTVCALDLGLTTPEKSMYLLESQLSSIEKLKKWNGHLLNWYDTRTMEPLRPECVSTVDSGNMAICLLCVAQGARKYAEQFEGFTQIADRAESLSKAIDFKPLFDKKRQLFWIGINITENKMMNGWYDLMASEARLTSFYCVACGYAGRKHWGRLGRALTASRGYAGMVSWTGSMFEYLMPELFLPSYENSLIYESSEFAIFCQKRKKMKPSGVWGMSESNFYAFDRSMTYQYKAHGVQRLGLKRGLNKESVIAPYAAFLALIYRPGAALRDLKKMEKLGLKGKYGFYEAVDFTPSHIRPGDVMEPVKSYMVHHLGMSMMAAVKVLKDEIIQKRLFERPEFTAFSGLLQEKVPINAVIIRKGVEMIPEKPQKPVKDPWQREAGMDICAPSAHILSNGSYCVQFTGSGMSRSVYNGNLITRFDGEKFSGINGIYVFYRENGRLISLTQAPFYEKGAQRSAIFDDRSVIYKASEGALHFIMEVYIPKDDTGEIRKITIINNGETTANGEILLYFEPVLSDEDAYHAHPAYSNIFIKTAINNGVVTAERRQRNAEETPMIAFAVDATETSYETSKERLADRRGLRGLADAEFTGGAGDMIMPCIASCTPIHVDPQGDFALTAAISCSYDRSAAVLALPSLLRQTVNPSMFVQTCAEKYKLAEKQAAAVLDITAALSFPSPKRRILSGYIEKNVKGSEDLWKYGISGDIPIFALRLSGDLHNEEEKNMIKGHQYCAQLGFHYDLVLLAADSGDYRRPATNAVLSLLNEDSRLLLGEKGGIHMIDADAVPEEDIALIMASANLTWPVDTAAYKLEYFENEKAPKAKEEMPEASGELGCVQADILPKVVWSQPLVNNRFGYIAADSGCGHLWSYNSRLNKLTKWENDPLGWDSPETLRMHDLENKQSFSVFKAADALPCAVNFRIGSVEWIKKCETAEIKVQCFVPIYHSARVFLLEGEVAGSGWRLEWMLRPLMGERESESRFIVSSQNPETGEMSFTNMHNKAFAGERFVCAASQMPKNWTCDLNGYFAHEADGRTGGGLEPCAAAAYVLNNGHFRIVLLAGMHKSEIERQHLFELLDWDTAVTELQKCEEWYRKRISAIVLKTPDEKLNRYFSAASLYQVAASRLFARASIYQCGGAYGFRDQLQDVCALMFTHPFKAKTQILRSAAMQYVQGDAMHWWHVTRTGGSKGVRTRCSDDMLWLVHAVCNYIDATGDKDILDIRLPYIESPPLRDGENERYEAVNRTKDKQTLLSHCMAAINLVLNRGTGKHDLLLMLGGDWNDGMNKVGYRGSGESVWLTFFAASVADRFSVICALVGDHEHAEGLKAASDSLSRAALKAYDKWYLRAYYDDGVAVGNPESEECRIDSIAQSFSVWIDQGDAEQKRNALKEAYDHLYDRQMQVVRLLTPPFENSRHDPGYIRSYPPGIRENGGQYTHAAVWLAMGLFNGGLPDEGFEILETLLPENHDLEIYKVENFVLAADVYTNRSHPGRGGWSWYTGAAGWYWQVVFGCIIGAKAHLGFYTFEPYLPGKWNSFTAKWVTEKAEIILAVRRGSSKGVYLNGDEKKGALDIRSLAGGNEILIVV